MAVNEILGVIGAAIEIVSLLLFFVVVYHVFNIRTILRGINGWNYIATGFLLIVFRRFLSFLLGKQLWLLSSKPVGAIIAFSESILLLLITILFVIGFYKLNKSFDKIGDDKLRDEKRRRK